MPSATVQSLDRAFGILDVLARGSEGASLSEIAKAVDLPKSTCCRLLSVLIAHEYARKSPETSAYRLGPGFIAMGGIFLNGLELQTESAPVMNELAAALGTVVYLARRQGDKVVYIGKEEGRSNLRKYSVIGRQMPVYCTALGKASLLDMDDEEARSVLASTVFEPCGPRTLGGVDALLADLRACRERGWAHDDQEAEEGTNCVAAPIRDYRGQIISAISVVWVLAARSDLSPEAVAPFVLKAAETISRSMGYSAQRG